jgi:hypothetical protein
MPPPTPPRIDMARLFAEAALSPWRNRRVFLDLATIPLIVSLAIQLVGRALIDDQPTEEAMRSFEMPLLKLIDLLVPTVMFMVGWHRFVLLGPAGVWRLPGMGWSQRETAFLLHMLWICAVPLGVMAVLYRDGEIDLELARFAMPAALVGALMALRLSFGLAASSVGVPWTPRLAWVYGRGATASILGGLFLVWLAGVLALLVVWFIAATSLLRIVGSPMGFGATLFLSTLGFLVQYAAAAAMGTAQALLFRELTGFRPGAGINPPPP